MKLPIVTLNFLHSPVISSLLGPRIPLSTLFSNTLSVYALPLIWETKLHTHTKQITEIWFLYILHNQQNTDQKYSKFHGAQFLRSWQSLNR
jgi:surface polysaccharide O-acyltransferase-like enzyme